MWGDNAALLLLFLFLFLSSFCFVLLLFEMLIVMKCAAVSGRWRSFYTSSCAVVVLKGVTVGCRTNDGGRDDVVSCAE